MKRTSNQSKPVQKSPESSEIDMDCSCEILYDDSLSNVSDGDCDCSQCLQANLNAFNQLKNQNVNTMNSTREVVRDGRKKVDGSVSRTKKEARGGDRMGKEESGLRKYNSNDRFAHSKSKNTKKWGAKAENEEGNSDNFDQFMEEGQFSNGQLNDFLLITKHRTRKYLQQKKKLAENQNTQKQQLRNKIKRNLQMLKYTAEMMRNQKEDKEGKEENGQQKGTLHPYKWNHSEYRCQCNGETDPKREQGNCCRKECKKKRVRDGLDTNLGKFHQDFERKRDQIISELKKKREEAKAQKEKQVCPDKCPNHHNRTTKQKIKKIEDFIHKNVAKYNKKLKKQKKEYEQKRKVLQAKLNAIDIRSKEIVQKCQRPDDGASKSSFRNSIQQYDTFSELREENERRKKIKADNEQIKKNPKMREQLLEKVYEDVEEDFELDAKKQNNSRYLTKGQMPQIRKEEEIYERIAYDAGIKAPKNIGKKVESNQKEEDYKKTKTKANVDRKKQQEEKKRIQAEIERKKKQIVQEYKKRNSNNPQNHEIRKEYQQKLEKTKSVKNQKAERDEPSRDPYRTNYQTKAGKNADQIRTHGDPLLQEYTYHREKERAAARKGEDMGIFTSNIHGLTEKKRLKP